MLNVINREVKILFLFTLIMSARIKNSNYKWFSNTGYVASVNQSEICYSVLVLPVIDFSCFSILRKVLRFNLVKFVKIIF